MRKEASQMVALIKRMLFLENCEDNQTRPDWHHPVMTLTSMFWVIPKFLVAAIADIVPVMTRVLVPGREIIRK